MTINVFLGMMLLVMMANNAQNDPTRSPAKKIERRVPIEEVCVECDDECSGCMEYCDCPFCLYDTVPTLTLHIYFKTHPAERFEETPRHPRK